jgi:hypothetical protein
MQNDATASPRRCLERVADGWRWRAIPNTGLAIMQAASAAFFALMGVLLLIFGLRIATDPDQKLRELLFIVDFGVLVVVAIALGSIVRRLIPWREAVFLVEGPNPQIQLRRGRRNAFIPVGDVVQVRVIYGGPWDGAPTDTYLEIRRAKRRLGLLVGRRGYEPTAASELRQLLPPSVEVQT